eukprot:12374508-Alexandrium_andersonii.AAC.1
MDNKCARDKRMKPKFEQLLRSPFGGARGPSLSLDHKWACSELVREWSGCELVEVGVGVTSERPCQ